MPTMKMKTSAVDEIAVAEHRRLHEGVLAPGDVDDEDPGAGDDEAESIQVSGEENQSTCSPRSSMSWSAPMASESMAKPKKSKLRCRRAESRQEGDQAGEREDADRQVDVEDPAPVEGLGQPAAEGRADDRADHDAGAPDRHRPAVPLARC